MLGGVTERNKPCAATSTISIGRLAAPVSGKMIAAAIRPNRYTRLRDPIRSEIRPPVGPEKMDISEVMLVSPAACANATPRMVWMYVGKNVPTAKTAVQ